MADLRYSGVSAAIQDVMPHIENYVIPENRRSIEYLWDMNIMTTQTNNYDNEDSWIALGELSEENSKMISDFFNRVRVLPDESVGYIGLIGYGRGFRVPVKPGTKDPFDEFKVLFSYLKYQDVQKDGYMTVEEFYLKYTDCSKYIPNPDYHPLPKPRKEDFEDMALYGKAYSEYLESQVGSRMIRVFDPDKCVKDLREYLSDAGLLDCYDEEEGKIFYNRRLYEGHMRYKKLMGEKKEQSI